ncbi:MAG: DUF4372 domain-containing protein [Desulfobacter sp.]|nr:MAG: DUF4372 domain-containing protein [Desulfobacter sp.]
MMVRHASLFSQLVAFFNRNKFMNLVAKNKTERYSKGFKSWDLISVIYNSRQTTIKIPEI